MNVLENISLRPYNTFGVEANARFYVEVETLLQLRNVLQLEAYTNKVILSGGSNILFTKAVEGLVVRICLKGITIEEETQDTVLVKAMAGENWHQFVLWTLGEGYGGLENLSLIPGCVGTSPIQNIGAYGVELSTVFHACEAMDMETHELREFSVEDCRFGYRDSVFKNTEKGKYGITSVTFRLTKDNHQLHTHYGAIEAELEKMGVVHPSIQDVSRAVIQIRQSKLPDPKVLGNSGSFFKNPILGKKKFERFAKNNPGAPFYELGNGTYKIPAGWLIEQVGLKGKRFGDAGVHAKQALVLVNHGNASGKEILALSKKIQDEVQRRFSVVLETEVNIF